MTRPRVDGVHVTRTLDASAQEVYRAIADPARRGWCHLEHWRVRSSAPGRALRLDLPDGSLLVVDIRRQGTSRCQLSVQQVKLPTPDAEAHAREAWRLSILRLAEQLDR